MAKVQADASWRSMTCMHQIVELTFEAIPCPTLDLKGKVYAFQRSYWEPPEAAAWILVLGCFCCVPC